MSNARYPHLRDRLPSSTARPYQSLQPRAHTGESARSIKRSDMIRSWPHEARRKMDWDEYFRQQAAMYRKLSETTEDAFINQELLDLAAVCEEVANNIEDRQTSG
jgi:hypothetical protein